MATARLCVANALDGANRRARELVVPHCTYTDPEVAQVGLTPRQAREEGTAIDEYRLELATYSTLALSGPLEDGSFVLDSVGEEDCRIETTVAPAGGLTIITVRYGAACPFE